MDPAPTLAADAGAALVYRPVLLGGIFQKTGNASLATVPAKGRCMGTDLQRVAKRYGVAFAFNPHFPIDTMTLMRIATGLARSRPSDFDRLLRTVFRAMWVNGANPGDAAVLDTADFDSG